MGNDHRCRYCRLWPLCLAPDPSWGTITGSRADYEPDRNPLLTPHGERSPAAMAGLNTLRRRLWRVACAVGMVKSGARKWRPMLMTGIDINLPDQVANRTDRTGSAPPAGR